VLRDRQARTEPDGGIFSGKAAHFLERHRHHKDTRNNHIAHSPNASDVTSSAAWIRGVCSDEPDIRRIGAIHAFRSSDATDDVRRMVKMVACAQAMAYGRMDRANNELNERVGRLPKERLKKLKRSTVYLLWGRRRRPHRASKREPGVGGREIVSGYLPTLRDTPSIHYSEYHTRPQDVVLNRMLLTAR
jgi:hypothetical protein